MEWGDLVVVPAWHFSMLNDVERNEVDFFGGLNLCQQFNRAIESAVASKKDPLVLDIGAGSGLLSMMAARSGANRIYACERVDAVASVARQVIQDNGFSDRITVITKESRELVPRWIELSCQVVGEDLPEAADIVVAEILDTGLIGEGMLISLDDARNRGLLASVLGSVCRSRNQDVVVIPSAATVYAQLIDSPHFSKIRLNSVSGFNLSAFNVFYTSDKNYEVTNLKNTKYTEVTEAKKVFQFDFNKPLVLERKKTIKFKVNQKGSFNNLAMAFWFTLNLDQNNRFDCSPSASVDSHCHWGQALQVSFKKESS